MEKCYMSIFQIRKVVGMENRENIFTLKHWKTENAKHYNCFYSTTITTTTIATATATATPQPSPSQSV
jgi:hypothetical protein